ncbi:MAG: SGNH/GDSL hydrolase family protein [Bacteroidales bacterium]|nr:SGNH/GDSL hydrolase family protein [Bacteroidales bacterium]
MKKFLIAAAIILTATSCGPKLYNVTKSYDDRHFDKLQAVLDNPTTPKGVSYSFSEASEIGLFGKMFYDTPNPYHRIDTVKYKGMTKGENFQARCSAGLCLQFTTDATTIAVKTKWGQLYSSVATMPIAYRGYDLYIKNKKGEWQWAASGATKPEKGEDVLVLIKDMAPGAKECILYLPNYCEIRSCQVGVPIGSYIRRLDGQFRHKIVFHGSSYTHGISTSRPGMSYPMQFMRHTGMQVLGFGMSGNCKMQPYFAAVLEDVEADAYVFDAFSNPDYKMIKERLQPFIDRMVAAHPGKPLIFQQTIYREARNFSLTYDAKEQAKQDMASTLFDQLLKDPKYADVYFIQTNACEKGSHEYSVDGVHPDDHGYYLWSKSIEKPILTILAKYGIK